MDVGIIGGGLAGLTLAYFLQEKEEIDSIEIFEKENVAGGLCRSFEVDGLRYDIGPHLLFSKNDSILGEMVDLLGDNVQRLKRANFIQYKDRFVQFPFENDLYSLPEEDKKYCIKTFLDNPYRDVIPGNMLEFFLKRFGEGITNLFLKPYNQKIWKMDPSLMGTQMVSRIPDPKTEDILRSARGEHVDGYTHQLHFYYPRKGGIQSLVEAILNSFNEKVTLHLGDDVARVSPLSRNTYEVVTASGNRATHDVLVSTIPVTLLNRVFDGDISAIAKNVEGLRYNSIIIGIVNVKVNLIGDKFVITNIMDDVPFHRVSRLDYLGEAYQLGESTTYLVEITHPPASEWTRKENRVIEREIIDGMLRAGIVRARNDVNFTRVHRIEHAYVVYDLHHAENLARIKELFKETNFLLHGRFGEFEYLNMDEIFERSMRLADRIARKARPT